MSTYRQNGLVAELLAVGNEAKLLGDPNFIAAAHYLYTQATSSWFPIVSGPLYQYGAEQLADQMAAASGRPNCLDQVEAATDVQPTGVAEPAQGDELVAQGDVGANLQAFGSDLSTSASDLMKTGKGGLYALALILALLLAFMIVWKSR